MDNNNDASKFAAVKHPVRDEIVQQVKERTKRWRPLDPNENPMRKIPTHLVQSSLGGLGMQESGPEQLINSLRGIGGENGVEKSSISGLRRQKQLIDYSKFITIPAKFVKGATTFAGEFFDQVVTALGFSSGDFKDWPVVGTGPRDNHNIQKKKEEESVKGLENLPKHYNIREVYPQCKAEILDQDLCGSCWGFSTAGMLEDRLCIRTNGKFSKTLSPQDMIDCALENYGCAGGFLVPSIDFLTTDGVTSLDCAPYTQKNEACEVRCRNPDGTFNDAKKYDKYFCKAGSFKILTTVEEMQRDIYDNGPITVSLTIMEDLYSYGGGVYHHVAGGVVGGHAMRVIGWGHDAEDNDNLYWICQNQWTDRWGNKGYINIKHGQVGIDLWALSCEPDVEEAMKILE